MAGKKKKSLANKLAKMSDEERARYLQHRAEIEEEARRRKEQLVATFMKKKIKKEEAFSRLNMAKINQNWHQIMRKIKVKEMKEDIEYLRKWIETLLEFKNRRISKLMEELEEAEEQYLHNFNSHSDHLNKITESQNEYIENLQSEYQEELDELLKQTEKERSSIIEHSNLETAYLKTVSFGQNSKASKEMRENWEYYSKQLYEVEFNNREKLRQLRKTRGETESALWQQILKVVSLYVQKTDVRRSHLQELKTKDAQSAEEIRKNEEKINKDEELIKNLTVTLEDLLKQKTAKISSLEAEDKILNNNFNIIRKTLKKNLDLDEKQLKILISSSNEALSAMETIFKKGQHLLNLSNTCKKFQTEREKLLKWLPVFNLDELYEKDALSEDIVVKEDKVTKDEENQIQKSLNRESEIDPAQMQEESQEVSKTSPQRGAACKYVSTSAKQSTDKSSFIPIKDITIEAKKTEQTAIMSSKSSFDGDALKASAKRSFPDECCRSLEKLENFWVMYNKTYIDTKELAEEKDFLEKENKQLRGLIRAVLESAALDKVSPESKVSTRAQSKITGARSAPLRRIIFS
ncbi:dynein regulatory complex subunit 2 [Anthonomus grandis grandis]|uniref:dynein regulatory complex subunit 2 n=1 Tax=Anthonomus grandis grandis TaxID=2921223 RepID=UPI002165FBD0|nr:dynein regulatory complex subunit 2 [Anthonomus grandis grandis]